MAAPAGFINPQDAPYNAAGDGSADDTAALNNALADCAAQGKDLWCPKASGNYRITSTVNIPAGVNVESWADWDLDSMSGPAVVVGTSGQHNDGVTVRLRVDIIPDIDWTDSSAIGVQALNCRGCHLTITKAGQNPPAAFYAAVNFHAENGFQCEGNFAVVETIFYSRFKLLFDGAGDTRDNLVIGGRDNLAAGPALETARGRFGPNARHNGWLNGSHENTGGTPTTGRNPIMFSEGPYNWDRHGRTEMANCSHFMVVSGAAAEGCLVWTGQHQHRENSSNPPVGDLDNGAPSGVNAYIPGREGPFWDVIGGVEV